MTTENKLHILHISDLHLIADNKESKLGNFDQSIVLDPLLERLQSDMSSIQPEMVIVTGDIAYHGKNNEYAIAKIFFDRLLSTLHIDVDKLFLVPGNHDVNRNVYRPTERISYENMTQLNKELEGEHYRANLLAGMEDYFSFVEEEYPHIKPLNNRLIPFVQTHTSRDNKKIGIVGLNSAWMCRHSKDKNKIAIGEYQVKLGIEELQKQGEHDLILTCFHHPLEWLWREDVAIAKKYFPTPAIFLCGHLHDVDGGFKADYDGKYYQFQAGATYLGSESTHPMRYQYLTFDWADDLIELQFRKFTKEKRRWTIDADTGDDGRKTFKSIGLNTRKTDSTTEKIGDDLCIPAGYGAWIQSQCKSMSLDNMQGRGQAIRVDLPEIFIPLYGYDPDYEKTKGKTTSGEESSPLPGREEKQVNIEQLISRHRSLLIQGEAGSGKTTVLRHLAYEMVGSAGVEGLEGFLPILIFLKDLAEPLKKRLAASTEKITVDELLSFHLGNDNKLLPAATLAAFIKGGRVLFLLDGLDEISSKLRKTVVDAFLCSASGSPDNRIVLSGRPHGVIGPALDHFGENCVTVLPLTQVQVELFIRKWFDEVEVKGKTAESMLVEMRSHDSIDALTDSPLMLTAICILYHDGRELPNQRAELYHKFIDNMIFRRFSENNPIMTPEKVKDFLKKLAFRMQTNNTRRVDEIVAVEIMSEIVGTETDLPRSHCKKEAVRLFKAVEPLTGLLRFEEGQFVFWHFTFQEFLAALFLQDEAEDFKEAIGKYWDDEWFKEVIKLYIGSLSINSKGIANKIVQSIVTEEHPSEHILLAAASLVDMHKDRRNEKTIIATRKGLFTIIDTHETPVKVVAEAGGILGWLGDDRNLQKFIAFDGCSYDTDAGESEINQGMVQIEPFEIGKYLVTNSWYKRFVEEDGYIKKEYWSPEGKKWQHENNLQQPRYWSEKKWNCPNAPVVGISWYEADAFCRWLSDNDGNFHYRMPTEIEWQMVAAGIAVKRKYPWGEWQKKYCNSKETELKKTSSVGVFARGNNPEGITDLAGNVWEWTSSDYHSGQKLMDYKYAKDAELLFQEYFVEKDEKVLQKVLDMYNDPNRQQPVLRGGCWFNDRTAARCAYRIRNFPSYRIIEVGFRCARTKK